MSMNPKLTYKKAGVNIDTADAAKREMADYLTTTDPRVLNRLGAFASLFEAKFPEIERPVLVLKMEEPGSKQLLAVKYNRIHTIGYDLIGHLINDIIVMGAKPLAVLDVIICGKSEKQVIVEIVKSISQACKDEGCTLVGGETSEQPGVIPVGNYVLAASVVGVVDKSKIIDGSRIEEGDCILGLASNGPHTNGYSLIRKIIENDSSIINERVGNEKFLDAILKPHRCYNRFLQGLFGMPELHGLAHITGGGIGGNLNRILPEGLGARIDLGKIQVLTIFKAIREAGNISDSEMLRVFNMGVGMTLVAHPSAIGKIKKHLAVKGCESYVIGEIVKGNQAVKFTGKLEW
jgi:phosphoribosylformylglycinamidine cyclo-ligase